MTHPIVVSLDLLDFDDAFPNTNSRHAPNQRGGSEDYSEESRGSVMGNTSITNTLALPLSPRLSIALTSPIGMRSVNSDDIPFVLGNLFAVFMNSHSISIVHDFFLRFCASECPISLHVYTLSKHPAKLTNLFGNFTDLYLTNLGSFYSMLENFYYMVPDATMTTELHRCCTAGNRTALYMSSFEWYGTQVTQTSELVNVANDGTVTMIDKSRESLLPTHSFPYLRLRGSVGFHTNPLSLQIVGIEIFYEFY